MVGSPDSVQKNVVLENNSLSAEQITGVENRKSKAGEAVLPVLRSVSLFLLGLLGVLLILLTLLVIAAEAARIICLAQAAKKQQGAAGQADPENGSKNLPVSLSVGHRCRSWLGNSSNRCRTRPQISGGRARRIYACLPSDRETYLRRDLLSPYEERTLNHFLEKLMEPVPGCSWKMRLKLRYACLRRVNTKKRRESTALSSKNKG